MIDKIKNLGLDKLIPTIYDFGGMTEQETWCKFAQKINIIIEHFNYLDKKFDNQKELTEQKLTYLLGEGMTLEVSNKILELINNGTLKELINTELLGEINTKVDNFKTEVTQNVETFKTEVNEQLDSIAYQLNNIKDNDDITSKLQTALNLCNGNLAIYKQGTFIISDTILSPNNRNIILGDNTTLKFVGNNRKPIIANSDFTNGNKNIKISGGIWDGNNENRPFDANNLIGLFKFVNVENFIFENITIKNPISFGTQFCKLNHFIIKNIKFDYNMRNENMDGIHLHGKCYNGYVERLYGVTNDDLLALNADDDLSRCGENVENGSIENIYINDILSLNGYRGIRLLSGTSLIDKISINNIKGKYKNAGVLLGKFVSVGGNANLGTISIDNINVVTNSDSLEGIIHVNGDCSCLNIDNIQLNGYADVESKEFITIASGVNVNNLNISNLNLDDNTISGKAIGVVNILGSVVNLNVNNINRKRDNYTPTIEDENWGRIFYIEGVVTHFNINNINLKNATNLMLLRNSNAKISTLNVSNLNCINISTSTSPIKIKQGKIENINLVNITLYKTSELIDCEGQGTNELIIKTNNIYKYGGGTNELVKTYSGNNVKINYDEVTINYVNSWTNASSLYVSKIYKNENLITLSINCKGGTVGSGNKQIIKLQDSICPISSFSIIGYKSVDNVITPINIFFEKTGEIYIKDVNESNAVITFNTSYLIDNF